MDLNQLVIFAKVAENQSFTKAAQELGLEKSTVSNKVSLLEKRLGVRLLNRTTRLVTLTEAGEGYYQYCHQLTETAQEADYYAETLTNEPQGVLRVSVSLDFGMLLIRELIKPFMQEYPKLKIDLFVIDREVDLIAERYDIALRIGPGQLKDSSLIGKKLFNVKMGLFVSPQFLREHSEPKVPDDLQKTPFVIFTKQQESVFKFASGFMPDDIQATGNLKINDMLISREAALSGLGIAIMPLLLVKDEVKQNKLKQILPEYELPIMTMFAVYPSRQWLPSKLTVFLEYLEKWIK